MNIGDIFIRFVADKSGLDKSLDEGEQEAERRGQSFGDKFGAKAKLALVGAGAAVGAFAVGAADQFVNFQQRMNEVFTLLPGISREAMDDMTAQVQNFSREFGVLPDDVVPALYQALSAGVPPDNVFAFLETANKVAKGGVTDITTAVNGLSSVVNAYGTDVIDAAKAGDIMFTAVRMGKTTIGELSSALSNVIPIAASANVGFGDVAAAIATMTAQGTPTSVAATQMRAALVELTKEGTKVDGIFRQVAGVSFREFIDGGGDVQGALKLLSDHADATGTELSDMFGSVEAGSAVLQLTGEGADIFTRNLDAMADSAGATDAAFDQMETGAASLRDKLVAGFRNLAIDIGRELEPIAPLLTAFGPTMGRALGAGLGGLAGFLAPKLIAGFDAALGLVTNNRFVKAAMERAAIWASATFGTMFAGGQRLAGLLGDAVGGAFGKVSSLASAAIGKAGAIVGAAFATAMQLAATGVQVVAGLAARIAAMAIPLAPAGATVGTAVGTALGLAMVAAVAVGGAGLIAFGPMMFQKLMGTDPESVMGNIGRTWANATLTGYTEEARTGAAAAFQAAWATARATGASNEAAAQAGVDAGRAYLESVGASVSEPNALASVSANIWTGFNLAATPAATAAGTTVGIVAGEAIAAGTTEAVERSTAEIARGYALMADQVRRDGLKVWFALGAGIPGEIGQGMQQNANVLIDGAAALRDILENGTSPRERAMLAIGKKYIKLVRDGMESEKDGAKETAIQVAAAAINSIEDAGLTNPNTKAGRDGLKAIGIYYDELLAAGLTAGEAAAVLAGAHVSQATIDSLESERAITSATAAGTNIAEAWVVALAKRMGGTWAINQVEHALSKALAATRGESPPKVGPLRHIDKWGANIGTSWVDGLIKGIRERASALAPVLVGLDVAPNVHAFQAEAGAPTFALSGDPVTSRQEVRHMVDLTPATVGLLRDAGFDEGRIAQLLGEFIDGLAPRSRYSTAASY